MIVVKCYTHCYVHRLRALKNAKSFAKIEMIQENVLSMNNVFNLSFFEDNKIYEKRFEFQKNTINESLLEKIPLMNLRGVLKS